MQRLPLRVFWGAALVFLGAGGVALSLSSATRPTASLLGRDFPINRGARDEGDISANNSPALARNPKRPANLAVANRIDSPRFSCRLSVSLDGGGSWSETAVPIPEGEQDKCFAPDVTFAPDGTMYLFFVTLRGLGNVPHAGWIVRSSDGGRTLSRPVRALGALAFQVRLTADPTRPGRLYLTWLQAAGTGLYRFEQPGNPIRSARSDDGGVTWEPPSRVSNASRARVVAPSPAVDRDGDLYVLYLDLGEDRLDYEGGHEGQGGPPYPGPFQLVLARSRDGGTSWSESVVDDRIVPAERFLVFLPPFPSVAVDPESGRIYAGFHDRRHGDADALVWSLRRSGRSWEGPVRVNDTPERDNSSQYLPRLAVAAGGRLDVVYYDRRADPRDVMNEVSLQSSWDGGESFGERVLLSSRAFDSRIGAGSERGMPDLGNRLGLISDESAAFAVWSDTRAGTVDSNKQDIAGARVRFAEPELGGAARYGLRLGGVALALAGLALLLSARRAGLGAPGM